MYCTDFVCTYRQHSDEYQNPMYQSQLLQAFSIKEWDDNIINREIENIFFMLKDNNDIKFLLSKIEISPSLQTMLLFVGKDDLTCFKLLFHFELFHLTHKLICRFINEHSISRDIIDDIVKLL